MRSLGSRGVYWRGFRSSRKSTYPINSCCRRKCYTTESPKKTSNPLRILFCGSDNFSSVSLRGIHEEQRRNPELIASIDVLCRPGKPSGRSLKKIREVPIKAVAQELGLPIHERDTFTGWELPRPQNESINLIIAVSFGLFVPSRILRGAEYGGLNVHPSILPNFRGPAPIHHTIMSGARYTGVTLQTLDEKSFDHGTILAQSPKGLELPFGDKCTYQDLLNYITPQAAAMLTQGLKDRVFIPPLIDVGWSKIPQKKLIHASRITPMDRYINWREHSVVTIERRYRALGRLWNSICLGTGPELKKRIMFEDFELVPVPKILQNFLTRHKNLKYGDIELSDEEKGVIRFMVLSDYEDLKPRYFVIDGDAVIISGQNGALRVKEITIEGKGLQRASKVLKGVKDWGDWRITTNNYKVSLKEVKPFSSNRAESALKGGGEVTPANEIQ